MCPGNNQRSPEEIKRAMDNAYEMHVPIFQLKETEIGQRLLTCDEGLEFPEAPEDILDYHGNIEPLGLTESEKEYFRKGTARLIQETGARWIWDNKYRLKLEILYVKHL